VALGLPVLGAWQDILPYVWSETVEVPSNIHVLLRKTTAMCGPAPLRILATGEGDIAKSFNKFLTNMKVIEGFDVSIWIDFSLANQKAHKVTIIYLERDTMLDVLIGCIWRYIYRPGPQLYKEGGGPNNKYKYMYLYT
jgi:hypothetical protein